MVGDRRNMPTDVLISSKLADDGWDPVGLNGLIFTFNFFPMSPSKVKNKICVLFSCIFRLGNISSQLQDTHIPQYCLSPLKLFREGLSSFIHIPRSNAATL